MEKNKAYKLITDLDDVLAKSTPAFINWLQNELGQKITLNELISLSSETIREKYGVAKEWVLDDAQKEFFRNETELEKFRPYPADLKNINSDMLVISGREASVKDITEYWLKKHFGFSNGLCLTNWNDQQKTFLVTEKKTRVLC